LHFSGMTIKLGDFNSGLCIDPQPFIP